MQKRFLFIGFLITLLISALIGTVFAQTSPFTPEIFTVDQDVVDGTVRVVRVTANEAGFVVIHADDNGSPGPVIGYAPIPAGVSANVIVPIDVDAATDTLYAMLHVDGGEADVYEGPGDPDGPVMRGDAVVVHPFAITGEKTTIVGAATSAGDFTNLLAALDEAGLTKTLKGDGPFTVFAPNDAAFAATTLPADLMSDPAALADLLNYHVVPGLYTAADLTDGMTLETAQGGQLVIDLSDGAKVNGINISGPDVMADNGVIHVIDAVLMPPTEEEAPEEEAAPEETEAATMDIVDTAIAAGNFTTLIKALEAADLVDTLKSEGPFTVFAPTDEAFAQLPEGTVDALLADIDTLTQVLLYHVVPGVLLSDDLTDGMEAETAQGANIVFTKGADGLMVNDALIDPADVEASNGVIQVIDKLILPPLAEPAVEPTAEATPTVEAMEEMTATVEPTVEAAEEMTATVEPTVEATAEMTATVEPTMEATEEMTATVEATEEMTATVEPTMEATEEMTATVEPTMAATEEMTATVEATAEMTSTAEATPTPSPTEEAMGAGNIVDVFEADGNFTILLAALSATGLDETLTGEGPFTIFAPTDSAFAALPEGTLDSLLADPDALTNVLLYHVAPGAVMSSDLTDGQSIGTVQGSPVTIGVSDGAYTVNDANITGPDMVASNGIIHAIDAVLLPPDMSVETPAAETPAAEATPTAEAGAGNEPTGMPSTGGSFAGGATSAGLVVMMLMALAAVAYVEKRRGA
ncbi:MAG: fasciclin domain-containing protein [Caldilineaceae bacterium]|nr:fasciclin domain-containing protein [Caldilineaceae bacterium]